MGGSEGSRGYLYQAFAAVVKALTEDDWDIVNIEYPSEKDKIDIALEKDGQLIKSIQVKSSINAFDPAPLKDWIQELIADTKAQVYELFQIGNCSSGTQDIINAINNFKNGKETKKSQTALAKLDQASLKENDIQINVFPYEIKQLQELSVAELHKYLSNDDMFLHHDRLLNIIKTMITDQLILSTTPKGYLRTNFEKNLKDTINLINEQYRPKRVPVGIRSYVKGAEDMESLVSKMLCLTDKFTGRFLKDGLDWKKDILLDVETFLSKEVNRDSAYVLELDTHSSIAFAVGKILNTQSGIDIVPLQKIKNSIEHWAVTPYDNVVYPGFAFNHENIATDVFDTALIISVTRNIYSNVIDYIRQENLPIKKVISCDFQNKEAMISQ